MMTFRKVLLSAICLLLASIVAACSGSPPTNSMTTVEKSPVTTHQSTQTQGSTSTQGSQQDNQSNGTGNQGNQGNGTGSQQGGQPSTGTAPFKITQIDLSMQPDTITGMTCGSVVTLTYTATFHIPAGSPGGTMQFSYSLNNGRSQTNESLAVAPGETTKTFTFTYKGALTPDHVQPGIAAVLATSPNTIESPPIVPGMCH